MTTNKVAYLITYISYSCVYNYKGTIDELLLEQFLLDEVSEYIINNSCSTKFETIDDLKKFWNRYQGYNVWEAYYIKNNDWINATPTDEDILFNIYEMTKSTETIEEPFEEILKDNLEEIILDKNIILDENNLNENEFKENELDENSIDFTISSENSFSEKIINDESLIGEDIEIDWKTISNQEQEEYNENWEE